MKNRELSVRPKENSFPHFLVALFTKKWQDSGLQNWGKTWRWTWWNHDLGETTRIYIAIEQLSSLNNSLWIKQLLWTFVTKWAESNIFQQQGKIWSEEKQKYYYFYISLKREIFPQGQCDRTQCTLSVMPRKLNNYHLEQILFHVLLFPGYVTNRKSGKSGTTYYTYRCLWYILVSNIVCVCTKGKAVQYVLTFHFLYTMCLKSIRAKNLSVNQKCFTCNGNIIPILVSCSSISIKEKN